MTIHTGGINMNFNKMVTFLSAAGIFALTSCGGGIKPPFDPVNPEEEITLEKAQAFANENFYDPSEVEEHKKTPKSVDMEWDFSKTVDDGKYMAQLLIAESEWLFDGKDPTIDVPLKDKKTIDDCKAMTPASKELTPIPPSPQISIKYYLHENTYLSMSTETKYPHDKEVGIMKSTGTADKNGYQTYLELNVDNCYMGMGDKMGFVNGFLVAKVNW